MYLLGVKEVTKKMDFSNLVPVSMYCPNCGHKLIGYKDADGGTRIKCDRCKVVMFSKFKSSKKETVIRVIKPNN